MREKLELFYRYWGKKVANGRASQLERGEIMILEIFADWLDRMETSEPQ